MAEKPRQEFYTFTHQALPEIFFNDPQKFLNALRENKNDFPRYIWGQMEKLAKIEEGGKANEIYVEISSSRESFTYLISLPQPEFPTEAYYIALTSSNNNAQEEEEFHFYTLEYDVNEKGESVSLFCEWVDQDMHQKLISGTEFSREYFLERVWEKIN